MSHVDDPILTNLIESNNTSPDFTLDGIHFGRGECYIDKETATHLTHHTKSIKCWQIQNTQLIDIVDDLKNHFYSDETYIIQWNVSTNELEFETKNIIKTSDQEIYFYWKGENAPKGFSPLPAVIEEENPSVERIVQWAEPPVFLQLFCGSFTVHLNHKSFDETPHLYILRGEEAKELHLIEVPLSRDSLRNRTSFVLRIPKENLCLIWHGNQANNHTQTSVRKIAEKVFGSNIKEINGKTENDLFVKILPKSSLETSIQYLPLLNHTQRLFYLNDITGDFLITEVECTLNSSHVTPFPFLQSHLYSATQPATFLLDDEDIMWIWQGWDYEKQNEEFKSLCFVKSIDYAKQKSEFLKKPIKVQKAVAGFEPIEFVNLFPFWSRREDVVSIQNKHGELHTDNPLIEILNPDNN